MEERLQMTAASVVRRGPATWAAITVTAALTAVVGASAVASVLRATGVLSVDRAAALQSRVGDVGFSYDEAGLRTAEGFAALVSVPVLVVCLVLLVGLLLTPSSREDFDRKALQRTLRERERARTARS